MVVTEERRPVEKARDEETSADWSLLSSQGRVLFYLALCPGSTVREMSSSLGLTERAIWGVTRTLRRSGMLHIRRGDARQHNYYVNLDAPLLLPKIHGLTLRPVLGKIVARAKSDPNDFCEDIKQVRRRGRPRKVQA